MRTQVGMFHLKDSLKLNQIEELRDQDRLLEKIIPVDQMFSELPEITATKDLDKLLHNGNSFLPDGPFTEGSQFRVYDSSHQFIGIYEYQKGDNGSREELKPRKIFLGGN